MVVRIIKLLISLIVLNVDYVRKWIEQIRGNETCGSCVVLYYHDVTYEQRDRFAQQMDHLVSFAKPIPAVIRGALKGGINYVAVTFDDGFACLIENAIPELIERNIPFTIFVPTNHLGKHPKWEKNKTNRVNFQQEIVMNESQLRGLVRVPGASIGSHCMTHSNLLLLGDDEASNEIVFSKRTLEDILGKHVTLLSFPEGAYNQKHVDSAKKAGYERAFTISPTLAFADPGDYVTGRVGVDPKDWPIEFRLKALGAYRWLPPAFALKGRVQSILGNCFRYLRATIGGNSIKITHCEKAYPDEANNQTERAPDRLSCRN